MPQSRVLSTGRRALGVITCLALLSACGGEQAGTAAPTDPPGTDGAGAPATGTATEAPEPTAPAEPTAELEGYEAVLAEVQGLDAEQRWERLLELAEQEEGTLLVYATISGDEIGPIVDGFLEATGSDAIDATFYRAGTNDVLRRIMEEESADARQADAVIAPGTSLEELNLEDLLQDFDTPIADHLVEGSMYGNWGSIYTNLYTAAWNTDLVGEADVPTTWEEVLAHPGSVGVEVKSYDWFATLVTEYFMAEQGLSEEEAVAVFADAGMVPVDGRTALTELTVAGQFDLAASTYTQNVDQFIAEGAPVAWEPPVQPLLLQPNGVAPVQDSDVPATALLFVDYLLGPDGQELLASFSRIPTNTTVEGSVPEQYEIVSIDVAAMVEDRAKWEELFATVTGEPAATG